MSTHLALGAQSVQPKSIAPVVVFSSTLETGDELPGVGAVFVKEPASGPAVGLLREADDGDRALLDGLSAGVVVDVGSGEAGADGVHRDLAIAQLPGEIHREHIERSFGSVIAERFDSVEGRGRIAVETDGSKTAGDVDDAGTFRGSKQGQKRLRELHRTEEVRGEGTFQCFD